MLFLFFNSDNINIIFISIGKIDIKNIKLLNNSNLILSIVCF
jgi:hypothetical protein